MSDTLTRDQLLRRGALGAGVLTLPGLLAACGGGGGSKTSPTTTGGGSKTPRDIHFSNWTLYLDYNEKSKSYPSLDAFEKKYGISVRYTEDINDNASFFAKIQPQLERGQSTGRDIVVLTDNSPYPAVMVERGWAEKLDKSAIPNIDNLQPALRHPNWDPNREYSLPWQSGMTGIATNLKLTKTPVVSMEKLLEDPSLKGKVTLLTEMADTMALVMLANGDDPSKVSDQTFSAALTRIKKSVSSGQIRQFTGNDYSAPLARGDLYAAMAWSGDAVQLLDSNKNLVWNLPDSGGDIWTDNMLIPKGGDVYTASLLMNWYYEPKIAAQVEETVNYICPVRGAKEVLAKTDPKAANNPLIFPTDEMLSQVHIFDAKAIDNPDYRRQWSDLISA